jgi:HlyD family secretion protein
MGRRLAWFIGLSFLILTGVGLVLWRQAQPQPAILSGVLESDEIRVGSLVGGRVREVLVAEGQRVAAGQVMVRLEPFDLSAQLAEAQADLAAARAVFEKLQAGYRDEEVLGARAKRDELQKAYEEALAGPRPQEIDQAKENLQLAQAELELAKLNFDRNQKLVADGTVSREEYDTSLSRLRVAQATVASRKSFLSMSEEGVRPEQIAQAQARAESAQADFDRLQAGYRIEEIEEARARVEAATAHVASVQRRLEELDVVAPADLVVETFDLRAGDLVAAGAPVASLVDPQRLWLRAYVPQRLLPRVAIGTELPLAVDGWPQRTFSGRVAFVARLPEFTPSNVQTPEERGRQVFRIKVELLEGFENLHPGMAAELSLGNQLPAE